jgi:hypothetical protein
MRTAKNIPGIRILASIATLCGALTLHGCEWFSNADDKSNPFLREPVDVV